VTKKLAIWAFQYWMKRYGPGSELERLIKSKSGVPSEYWIDVPLNRVPAPGTRNSHLRFKKLHVRVAGLCQSKPFKRARELQIRLRYKHCVIRVCTK